MITRVNSISKLNDTPSKIYVFSNDSHFSSSFRLELQFLAFASVRIFFRYDTCVCGFLNENWQQISLSSYCSFNFIQAFFVGISFSFKNTLYCVFIQRINNS